MEAKDTNKISKILLIDNGKVLLLFSNHLKKYHLPGGHLQMGESFTQGVKREVKEETGLTISWVKIIFSKINFTLFKGGAYRGTVKLSSEHSNYVWAPIESAHKYNLCDFTKRDIFGLQKMWKRKNKLTSNKNRL